MINLVSRVLCFLVIDALVTVFDFQRQEKGKERVLIRPRNSDEQLGEESSRMQRKSLETWELLGGILWLNLATFQPFYPDSKLFRLTRVGQVRFKESVLPSSPSTDRNFALNPPNLNI